MMDMKDKIAKLLVKAERTDNEHERETFTAAAERLMLKLGIERAELENAGKVKAEEIVEASRDFTGGYSQTMVTFAHYAALAYGGLNGYRAGRGSFQRYYVVGHTSDVEAYLQLLDSLILQAMSALHRWQKTEPSREWQNSSERFIGSRSFLEGYGLEINRRLKDMRSEVQTEASPGAALVLVSKDERVADYMAQAHGDLRGARASSRTTSSTGRNAGRVAGQQASFGEKGVRGGRRALSS